MKKIDSILAGISGEYFVAAELSKRNLIASITLRNTRGVDILCSDSNSKKSIGIQVKTSHGSNRTWILNQKAEEYYGENLFYVFVNLNDNKKHPDFFIVPSKIVSNTISKSHKKWLKTPGKNGRKHKDNPMRKFHDPEGTYLNKWDILGL